MIVIGNSTIKLVQGDSYQRSLTLEGIEPVSIEGIYFSCKGLNICKKLDYVDGVYTFNLSAEETKNFKEFYGDYDITIRFIDNKIQTAFYKAIFNVLPKTNEVSCYDE